MNSFNWESFLRQWSQEALKSINEVQLAELPQAVIQSGWLGYPGATEEQISQAESRLGVKLPPSYREFLQVTNGWRQTTPFIRRLWSTEGIERFASRHQKWIEAFTHHHEDTQGSFDHAIELDELWEAPSVADEAYFVYGEEQDCSQLRVEYLKTAIEISDVGEDAIYLLNPRVITEAGEWEAWFFADWLPGADRYSSFQEMMEAEYDNFLELRGSASARGQSTESVPPAIAEPLTDSSGRSIPEQVPSAFTQESSLPLSDLTAEDQAVMWRSLRRLIVEFQTRQIGDRLEYRTVTTAEGAPGTSWAGLGQQNLRRWLHEQLAEEIRPPVNSGVASAVVTAVIPKPETAAPIPPKQSQLTLTLEIDQLAIRQDARLDAHIIVNPAVLKQAKRTGHASLSSHHPFSLEVVFNLLGPGLSDMSTQPITYQAQFHAQNRTTGQWVTLGESRPNALVSHQRTYTAYLFGNTLAPGMYRLQVLTTLRGAAVALTALELPLLNVV
jgi:hypothetical protein